MHQGYEPTTTPTSFSAQTHFRLEYIWLELTRKCNLLCAHCYADSNPWLPLEDKMNAGEWKRVLEEAALAGCKSVQFIGGEVLLVPYLRDLLGEADRLGFETIEVFTNATLVTDDLVTTLRRYGASLATSFYSCTPEVHDNITQRTGSWKRTVGAIRKIQASGVPLRVGIIGMEINQASIKETLAFLRELGVEDIGVDMLRSFGRGATLRSSEGYEKELCGRCGEGRICVASSGEIYPCIMAKETCLGNFLSAASLRDAIEIDRLANFRTELRQAKQDQEAVEHRLACTPGCWPNGGCAPHDVCNPNAKPCSPDCFPNGGCSPHDLCTPDKKK